MGAAQSGVTITLSLKDTASGGLQKFTGVLQGVSVGGVQAGKAIAGAGQATAQAVEKTSALGKSYQTLAWGMKAFVGLRAAQEVKSFVGTAMGQAIEQEEMQARLAAFASKDTGRLAAHAEALGRIGKYSSAAIEEAMTLALAQGLSTEETEKLVDVSFKLARFYRQDMFDIVRRLTGMFEGQTAGVNRLGLSYKSLEIEQLKGLVLHDKESIAQRDAMVAMLQRKAAMEALIEREKTLPETLQTTSEKLAQQKNAWLELAGAIGTVVIKTETYKSVSQGITDSLRLMTRGVTEGLPLVKYLMEPQPARSSREFSNPIVRGIVRAYGGPEAESSAPPKPAAPAAPAKISIDVTINEAADIRRRIHDALDKELQVWQRMREAEPNPAINAMGAGR